VGADPDADTEHLVAVDFVTRTAAAIAAADVGRAPEPPGVPLAGEPYLCLPDLPARHCISAATQDVPYPPAASLPAVTYALPKRMRSALGWTDADRVPHCKAYPEVTSDAVKGTSRTKDNLWVTVHKDWGEKVGKQGPMRLERLPSALEKQVKRIRAGLSAIKSHYLAVNAMRPLDTHRRRTLPAELWRAIALWKCTTPSERTATRTRLMKRHENARPRSRTASGSRGGASCGRVTSFAAPPTTATTRA